MSRRDRSTRAESAVLVFILSLCPIAVTAQDPPADALVRAAIESGNLEYRTAYAESDAEALARVYDPRGARLSANGRVIRGRAEIAASVGEFMSRVGPVTVDLELVDLWVLDDQAFETGIWAYTYTPPGQDERTVGGRYVTVWRRQPDGGWRILGDVGVPGTSLP